MAAPIGHSKNVWGCARTILEPIAAPRPARYCGREIMLPERNFVGPLSKHEAAQSFALERRR